MRLRSYRMTCRVCVSEGGGPGSEEMNIGFLTNISKNMKGVNVLVEDKAGDDAVMTSLLWCVLRP